MEQVVAADVDDESPAGTNSSDVVEVLFRPDTDVDAADCMHLVDDLCVGAFVRDQIVGVEVAAGLGEGGDEIDEARRFRFLGPAAVWWRGGEQNGGHEAGAEPRGPLAVH